MAFVKKEWKDRLVEFAGRRKITNVTTLAAQIVDVERAEGVTSEEGSAFSAANMNDLEQRVENAIDEISKSDASNMVTTFSQASGRTNLVSGEKISTSFGKIMKWLADLKTVAFSGSYSDLSNRPSIPGGSAASCSVANNCSTTVGGTVLDGRQGKVLMDKANQISSDLTRVRTYVGSDGKIHFVNSAGADTVLPFKSGLSSAEVLAYQVAPKSCGYASTSLTIDSGFVLVLVKSGYGYGNPNVAINGNYTTIMLDVIDQSRGKMHRALYEVNGSTTLDIQNKAGTNFDDEYAYLFVVKLC